ncbi:MAG TPA: bacillithiol biosynthesis BshC [Terriglobales bacterium]|nr:bacillithiol biosynthesis BshC [Terriglobales bacterium]
MTPDTLDRLLPVRARVRPCPDPPYDRLFDPIIEDLVADGPLAHECFATRWRDDAGLSRLAAAKQAALPAPLAAELTEYHRRLGASSRSLEALARLARGEAVCAVAGQQPAPLGGPLYSLHKISTAVGLASVVAERTGRVCVPLFWMHGEDSDFAEIRTALFADPALQLVERSLPEDAHTAGGILGAIPAAAMASIVDEAARAWTGLAGRDEAVALARGSIARGRDLGEAFSALVLALFADEGVVVVDPRLPAFRAAARPVIERYLANGEALAEAARRAGAWLESRTGRHPLTDSALESFVFAIEDGRRRKLSLAEARALGGAVPLSPSVALRPVVQDAVFPTVAMACGPGETAYLAQLRAVFEGLGVAAASIVPRLGLTWLPPPARTLLEAAGGEPWEIVTGVDTVVRRLAEDGVPGRVRSDLESAHGAALRGLERFAASVRAVDASLPQLVESARAKVDFQFQRLGEGLVGKLRHRLEREHPEWARLRYYLLPGDRLQERRLASLEIVAYRGRSVVPALGGRAAAHARALTRGVNEHLLVEL